MQTSIRHHFCKIEATGNLALSLLLANSRRNQLELHIVPPFVFEPFLQQKLLQTYFLLNLLLATFDNAAKSSV